MLTQVHIWVETFVSLKDDYTFNVLHEVQLHEEVDAGHVLYPGIGVIFILALPTGKFPLLCQVSTPWNPKASDEGGGKKSSECMTL